MLVHLEETHGGRVARLALSAPPSNHLSIELLQELERALSDLAGRRDLACLVLEGSGNDFSLGLPPRERRRPFVELLLPSLHAVARRIASLEAVVLAKVRGRCLGAACEWLLLSHVVLADPGARLGFPDVETGAFPPLATLLLPERIGRARAEELLLTGRTVDAEEGARLGLVTAFSGGWESLDSLVERQLEQLLRHPPAGLATLVAALRRPLLPRLGAELDEAERLYLERIQDAEAAPRSGARRA